jgi:hypothetical protein
LGANIGREKKAPRAAGRSRSVRVGSEVSQRLTKLFEPPPGALQRLSGPKPSPRPLKVASAALRKRTGSRSPFAAALIMRWRNDLPDHDGLSGVIKVLSRSVESLTHEPGRFVVPRSGARLTTLIAISAEFATNCLLEL